MKVYETDIPGVGRKFELDLAGETSVVVVLHHDGRCEVFRRDGPETDGERVLDLSGEQANRLGSILEGAYFESVNVDDLSVPLGDAIIEWVDIPAASDLVGATLRETDIRNRTGVSVVAIQRGGETEPNPGPDFELAGGDILVTLGTREEQTDLRHLVES
jgi:TrkA domain protein